MLTQAPLPRWIDLIRVFAWPLDVREPVPVPWCREREIGGRLSRSAWSLALVSLWRAGIGGRRPVVWLPDYFCNEALAPLRASGAALEFYPIDRSLEPNLEVLGSMAEQTRPDIVVLVHYFGRPASASMAMRDFCSEHGAWMVEDAAHVLRPIAGIGQHGDFVLYSPHKHLPLPDGAVLVLRGDGPGTLGEIGTTRFGPPRSWPAQLRNLEKRSLRALVRTVSVPALWFSKRVLQLLGIHRPGRVQRPYGEVIGLVDTQEAVMSPVRMSLLSRRLARGLYPVLPSIARARQRNALRWDATLVSASKRFSLPLTACERPSGNEWTPYLASYRAPDDEAERAYASGTSFGLPLTSWPDLPPEVSRDRQHHREAWRLRHTRMFLPVHQTVCAGDIHGERLAPAATSRSRLSVDWTCRDRAQWNEWLGAACPSNLLQSWDYGEAKAATEGWRVMRGVIRADGTPVAIVQVLTKRLAGVIRVWRVNRGPLALRSTTLPEQHAMFRLLAEFGRVTQGRLLSIAPELPLSGDNLALLHQVGLRPAATKAMQSVMVDLGLDLDALRAATRGSWRKGMKDLDLPARKGVRVEITNEQEAFAWMMERYEELMRENHFAGIPLRLLQQLRGSAGGRESLLVARAMCGEEAVSGICVALHGSCATYLVGWNGPAGRKVAGSQMLLWTMVKHLKATGVRWFDLGGIDEENTPGISAFKLGLGGVRYELIGEYWGW